MSRRHTFVLLVVAVVALIAAFWATSLRTPVTEAPEYGLLYPTLDAQINSVDRITLRKAGDEPVADIVRAAAGWQLADRQGYPADSGKIRSLLITLAGATIVEQKTANPEYYARLGVGDVVDSEAQGVRVEIGGTDQPLALIVGETASTGGTYVRRADDAQSLLVDREIRVDAQTVDWIRRDVVDIASSKVHEVRITHADGAQLRVGKSTPTQSNFDVDDIPPDRELSFAGSANAIGNALTALRLDDVLPVSDVDLAALAPVDVQYRLFDGTVLQLRAARRDEQRIVHIRVSFDEALAEQFAATEQPAADAESGEEMDSGAANDGAPARPEPEDAASTDDDVQDDAAPPPVDARAVARDEAAVLDARLRDWVFEIPSYKYDQLTRRIDDLLKSEDED